MRASRFLPLVLLLMTVGCVIDSASAPPPSVSGQVAVSVTMPSARLPGLHRRDATLDATGAAADATHPDSLAAILSGAELVGVRERTYTGAHGAFARMVIRAWVFTSKDGAGSFVDWVRINASHELIGEAAPLAHREIPGNAFVMVHEPSGCCHEETPIYLATWQRGHIVWTVRASGPRIKTAPVLALVDSIEQEV
jgi:hypothetical protein